MFGIIKQLFIVLLSFVDFLASVVNAPNYINGISLNNQQCLNQPTLINLNPNENTQGLHLIVCFYHVTYEFESESTLYSLAKWLSVRLRTKWLWVRIPLHSRITLLPTCS